MSHIFISYSHKDKAYVHSLHCALVDRGFDAWIDDRIDYGSRWPREIETRLQGCSAFILVMSPDAKESDWVQNELLTAQKLKKPIVPLLLEGEVWWHVQTTQALDMTGGQLPPENFFINLAGIVARHQADAKRSPVPAEKPKNEGVSIHVAGDVSGNIIFGDGNAAKSGATRRGSGDPRPTSGDPRPTPTAPVKRGSPDPRFLRSQPAGFEFPASLSGRLTIFLTVLAAISVCAAVFVSIFGYPPLGWFENTPAATLTPALTATVTLTPAPSLTPTPKISPTPYPLEIAQKGAKMALIPAGTFMMGSNKGEPSEKPIHAVSLAAFYMDKYEVTNALYKACVDAGGCSAPSESKSYTLPSYYGNSQFDNYPVIYVDWNQATTYCAWRGARLPSEAEWEYAARGTDSRAYPWGDAFDGTKVNFCDKNCPFDWANKNDNDGYADTAPVGSYESGKSPFGVYDVAGNVWEWVNDWYDAAYYAGSPVSNPAGPASGQYRVLRGGSWDNNPSILRVSARFGYTPGVRNIGVGFRCAR